MEESNIIKQFNAGDKNAINELHALYSNKLYRFAFGYLKSDADALDVVQEVFIRLWSSRNELKKNSNIEALLFTIAKNTIITAFRKRISEKEYVEHLKTIVVKNSLDTEQQVDYSILSDKVKELINQLPQQRQRIYLLSKEKGLTNKEIAENLGISIKTVEDHITKARKFLRENLAEYGFLSILFYTMFVY